MYLNKLKSRREACRHGRQHRNLSATVNWNPNPKISLPVGGTEINLSAEQICRVHALSPVSTRHRPVRSNTNDGGHGDPTSRSDLARDKGIFDLSTSFSQSTMTWEKKTKLDMVEWWGSGGGLDGGSFRALSFATEYSPSNYFTDSGNHLRSNDDEFYQMSPLLLQTIQLQKRRREVFPWRDPQQLPEGKIAACGGRFFSFQGFFFFRNLAPPRGGSCKPQIKNLRPYQLRSLTCQYS